MNLFELVAKKDTHFVYCDACRPIIQELCGLDTAELPHLLPPAGYFKLYTSHNPDEDCKNCMRYWNSYSGYKEFIYYKVFDEVTQVQRYTCVDNIPLSQRLLLLKQFIKNANKCFNEQEPPIQPEEIKEFNNTTIPEPWTVVEKKY